jgi:hypothetical protein
MRMVFRIIGRNGDIARAWGSWHVLRRTHAPFRPYRGDEQFPGTISRYLRYANAK